MKRKIFFTMIISAFIAASAASFVSQDNKYELGDLSLNNVEALAQEESSYDFPDGYAYTMNCGVRISKWRNCSVTVVTCQGGGKGCNESGCPTHPRG